MGRYIEKSGYKTEPGRPYVLGPSMNHLGCNFALFSRNAEAVELLFFNGNDCSQPSHVLHLDPLINRTGDVWHIFVRGIDAGQCYGYRVKGPYTPLETGDRFNENKLLLDPYALAVSGEYNWDAPEAYGYDADSDKADLSFSEKPNVDKTVKSVVVNSLDYDWENDKPLQIPMSETIIYEMHVRGFTRHHSSGVRHPGTYRGVIEKIPYLRELGITTVELLPVQHFNYRENTRVNPETGKRLVNFWGYSTLGFFAPQCWYAAAQNGLDAVNEFKGMVKELHRAGIEVILDVAYNHSGEGNEFGPTVGFRGLDNSIYYMLEDNRFYKNYSGCGNTLNCNHPVVKTLIKDSLRYWVVDMHVDGFRFDLAAILGRDPKGQWVPDYSVLNEISHDPILSNTKLIAEGWDAAGLFKVGGFPARWAEWNARFRDDVRAFVRGQEGNAGEVAKRLTGSQDLFHRQKRKPYHSINFITAHDGFTLRDLVSYNKKNNYQNGEDNNDGLDNNISWNCGVEGPTDNKKVLKMRERQQRNLFTITMISQGTPMILAGDEFGFSKNGNNNTYCHDNELNWLNWNLLDENKNFYRFCRYVINFRRDHPALRRELFFMGRDTDDNQIPDISWHGIKPYKPDWSNISHIVAFMIDGSASESGAPEDDNNIYVAINAFWESLQFQLPEPGPGAKWHIAINTAKDTGFYKKGSEQPVESGRVRLEPRSMIVCIDK